MRWMLGALGCVMPAQSIFCRLWLRRRNSSRAVAPRLSTRSPIATLLSSRFPTPIAHGDMVCLLACLRLRLRMNPGLRAPATTLRSKYSYLLLYLCINTTPHETRPPKVHALLVTRAVACRTGALGWSAAKLGVPEAKLGTSVHVSCGLEVCLWKHGGDKQLEMQLHAGRTVASPRVWVYLPGTTHPGRAPPTVQGADHVAWTAGQGRGRKVFGCSPCHRSARKAPR